MHASCIYNVMTILNSLASVYSWMPKRNPLTVTVRHIYDLAGLRSVIRIGRHFLALSSRQRLGCPHIITLCSTFTGPWHASINTHWWTGVGHGIRETKEKPAVCLAPAAILESLSYEAAMYL
jgi:hypothetical protein